MKLLNILKKDIAASVKSDSILLFVIILGMGSALLTHLISFSVIQYESCLKAEYSVYNTLTVPDLDSNDKIDFDRIISNDDVVNAFVLFAMPENDIVIVGWHGLQPANWFPLGEGDFISPDTERFSAYVSDTITLYRSDNHETITISGEEYDIIGSTRLYMRNLLNGLDYSSVSTLCEYKKIVFIPLEQLLLMEYYDAYLRIQIQASSLDKYQDILQFANNVLDEAYLPDMIYPPDPFSDMWVSNLSYFILIGILCIISFVNILAMYWNFLSKNKRKYSIFSFVGATPAQLWIHVVLQYFIYFFCSSLIAILFASIMRPWFAKLNICYNVDIKDSVAVILFELTATFAISVPKMKKIVRQWDSSKLGRGNG